jgi:hypothetical protein
VSQQRSGGRVLEDNRAVFKAEQQSAAKPNNTGLPDNLKSGIENLSGMSMDHVKVHYNSSQPAQLNALAYAQGSDIHVAPGQEKHVPHEAWHVVQQAQGRVKPTMQMKGMPINNDIELEQEADVMGERAAQMMGGQKTKLIPDDPQVAFKQINGAAGSNATPSIQRVIGPQPEATFRANLAWATWFQAMSEGEVRAEATKLGLARVVLDTMSELLERHMQDAIKIPGNYAAPSIDPVDGTQSPFRFGAVAAPVDASEKPARDNKVRRRDVASPVKFTIYNKTAEPDVYTPKDRQKSLSTLAKPEFDYCCAHANEAILRPDGMLAITLAPKCHIAFTTGNAELLGEELAALHAIRYEEAEPRSGASRAAADENDGMLRPKRDVEAPYAGPTEDIGEAEGYGDYQQEIENSVFTSTIQQGMIFNQVVHSGPWAKGERSPSQMGVMAGQNAKNYFLDNYIHDGRKDLTPKQRQEDLNEMGGRFEWLHIIGSSLGGPNVLGNLVCGTYDANTEMIALEHRIALWGSRAYKGSFRPTPKNPLKIVGIAVLEGSGFVAKQIIMLVYYGNALVLRREYATLQETFLTKTKYKQAEQGIEADIEKARGGKKDDTEKQL